MSRTAYTLVLGLGVTGASCVRHLAGRGRVIAMDSRTAPPSLAAVRSQQPEIELHLGGFDAGIVGGAERIVASPGIAHLEEIVGAARARGVPVLSDIDLFMAAARAPVLGITGTNGKSTVTALAGHLLAASGVRTGVGGNLGPAALDLLDERAQCYVLELSSFQLDLSAPLQLRAATVLNLSADHLDRYGTLALYAAAKRRIYARAAATIANRADDATSPDGAAATTTFGPDAAAAGHFGAAQRAGQRWLLRGQQPLIAAAALPLRGRHNEQNTLAALALVEQAGLAAHDACAHLATFSGLPHRCQLVAVEGGVEFVDDSKATNLGATLAALAGIREACTGAVVLIAGGDGKGADFSELAAGLPASGLRAVITIGRDGPLIARALATRVDTHEAGDLRAAVARARQLAQPGDCVLLAPACASFDQFRNFEERGRRFRQIVRGEAEV